MQVGVMQVGHIVRFFLLQFEISLVIVCACKLIGYSTNLYPHSSHWGRTSSPC
jgi:hypothetical protein